MKPINRNSILILLFLVISTCSYAQNKCIISGQVKSQKTHKPMHMANVYLFGTNFGDAVSEEGNFEIRNIPPGDYTLVISMIGFKKVEINLDLNHERSRHIAVFLKEEVLLGETILVEAEEPVAWKKNLEKFKNAFFGLSKFAPDCKLLNPEVLDFKIKKLINNRYEVLTASTVQPLEFINNALGYKILYSIVEFRANLTEGKLFYIGEYTQELGGFTIIDRKKFYLLEAENVIEYNKREMNRRSVYKRSFRHFLYSLAHNSAKEDGYKIRSVIEVSTGSTGRKILPKTILGKDTLGGKYFLDLADKGLEESHGYAYVIQIQMQKQAKSILFVPIKTRLEFDSRGIVISTPDFSFSGFWSWQCSAAHWLPEDYVYIPNEDN